MPLNSTLQNSKHFAVQEEVPPADGRGETKYFALVSLFILLLAATLLWLRQSSESDVMRLPNNLSNHGLQISNASVELNVMAEAGMIAAPQDVLPGLTFVELEPGCFVNSIDGYHFALDWHNNAWSALWTSAASPNNCHESWYPL